MFLLQLAEFVCLFYFISSNKKVFYGFSFRFTQLCNNSGISLVGQTDSQTPNVIG